MDNRLYLPDKEFIRNYLPFYTCLGKDKKPLEFKEENKNKFLEVVLPKIHETMVIELPAEMKAKYIVEDVKSKIYF